MLRLALLAALPAILLAYPSGAPDRKSVCASMKPGHAPRPEVLPKPFDILVSDTQYRPGETLNVIIRAHTGFAFKGFMIQARRADWRYNQTEPIGYFGVPQGTKNLCSGRQGNGLTHTGGPEGSETLKQELRLVWRAPALSQGHIEFRVTIVSAYNMYWVAEKSEVVSDPDAPPIPPIPTEQPLFQRPLSSFEMSGCGDTKGCYRHPAGCTDDENCDALVTWLNRGDHIEFQMEGKTDGWVAIGFSSDKKMGDDSVIECVRNAQTGFVEVRQSFNDYKTNYVLDGSQQTVGLKNIEAHFGDGRIRCRFTRKKKVSNNEQIFNLEDDYHLLLAQGEVNDYAEKYRHTLEPMKFPYVSPGKVDFNRNVDLSGRARYFLVKVHGCLMLFSWMMCASLAIMMARYYKPMWPNDRLCGHRVWFAVHRGCNVTAMICTIIGFIVIFIHVGGYSQMPELPQKAHPPLGITVTILAILNPLIALCRPSPKMTRRPVFNWFHWLFGTAAHVLATPTIFIGLSIYKAFVPWWATWVMVAFMLFHVICELLLEIHGCINGRKQKQRTLEYELRRKAEGDLDGYEPNPVGTRFKTTIMSLYVCVLVILGLVMIITVAAS